MKIMPTRPVRVDVNLSRKDIPHIRRYVAEAFGVTEVEMMGQARDRLFVEARRTAMALVRDLICCTSVVIGNHFNRDHSSVRISLKRHDAMMADADKKQRYDNLKEEIRTAFLGSGSSRSRVEAVIEIMRNDLHHVVNRRMDALAMALLAGVRHGDFNLSRVSDTPDARRDTAAAGDPPQRGQSHVMSVVEVCANVATGLGVSFGLGAMIYPAFGFPVTPVQNIQIVLIFTVASVLRGYIWRRLFNRASQSDR